MTDLRACVIGTLTTHGFLPQSRTQEGNSGRAPTPSPDDPTEGAGIAGNPLTDTSRGMDIAEYIEAQKRKDATHGT